VAHARIAADLYAQRLPGAGAAAGRIQIGVICAPTRVVGRLNRRSVVPDSGCSGVSGRGSLWQACLVCENRTSGPIAVGWAGDRGSVPDGSASEGIGIVGDGRSALPCRPLLLLDDLAAQADALVADVDARPSDQPGYFALRLPTERAAQRAIDPLRGWRALEHEPSVFPFEANSHAPWAGPGNAGPPE
jgi:hypothetical protein